MTIQPLSPRPREISVTESIEPAYGRVKFMLFQPFDLAKWITIGFCAWLAGLGESGMGGSYAGYHGGNGGQVHPDEQFRQFYHKASDFVVVNLSWILPVAAFALLLLLAIWVGIIWVSSRGKFMFLHCVVWDRAEVDVPWRKFAAAANSLFWFRLAFGFIGMVLMLPLVTFAGVTIVHMIVRGDPEVAGILLCAALGMVFLLLLLLFGLIQKFLVDFVVPIMFLRGGTCLAAWRELWALLCAWPGQFTLYILFQIVLNMAISALIVTAILVTCCLAGCLMALPFIGTVLLLPVLIFKRAYPLYYLAQFGPEYDIFPTPPTPPASPDPLAQSPL